MNWSLTLRSTTKILKNIIKRQPILTTPFKWPHHHHKIMVSLSSSSSNEAKSSRVDETSVDEDDWFKKIVKNEPSDQDREEGSGIGFSHSQILKRVSSSSPDGPVIRKSFNDLKGEEKRSYILAYYEASKEQGLRVPKELNDEYMNVLMRSETYSHFKRALQRLVKEDYYQEKRELKKKMMQEKHKLYQEAKANNTVNDIPTNYPGHYCFLNRMDISQFRNFYQHRVIASIRTNEPSIVFDLRFAKQHTRLERLKSLYRQFAEIISINRESLVPFQLHFCNYDYDSEFHQLYGHVLKYERTLVFETPKSYCDIFDRDKLVYLSADAPKRMTSYDPNKTYIIGGMIDMNPGEFQYYSYAQAKKDRITMERLPLEIYQDWKKSKKNLGMDKVFSILLKLKHGCSWEESFKGNLPGSKNFTKINYNNDF